VGCEGGGRRERWRGTDAARRLRCPCGILRRPCLRVRGRRGRGRSGGSRGAQSRGDESRGGPGADRDCRGGEGGSPLTAASFDAAWWPCLCVHTRSLNKSRHAMRPGTLEVRAGALGCAPHPRWALAAPAAVRLAHVPNAVSDHRRDDDRARRVERDRRDACPGSRRTGNFVWGSAGAAPRPRLPPRGKTMTRNESEK